MSSGTPRGTIPGNTGCRGSTSPKGAVLEKYVEELFREHKYPFLRLTVSHISDKIIKIIKRGVEN